MQLRKKPEKQIRASTGFEPVTSRYIFCSKGLNILLSIEVLIFYWSPDFFFRLLSQLHKLRSQMRESFFIWFHFCSSRIWFISFTFVRLLNGATREFKGCFCKSGPLVPSFSYINSQGLQKWREVVAGLGIWLDNSVKATRLPHRPVSEYCNIPKISSSKYKPPKIVTQKTLR